MQDEKNGKLGVEIKSETNTAENKKKWYGNINKDTLPYKLHFLLFVGGMGAVLPYQSVYGISQLGLTAGNLAAAYTAQQFLFLLFKPGIGYLADYFNRLKATIVGLTILQAIFCFLMILIPNVDVHKIMSGYEPQVITPSIKLNNCHMCNSYLELNTMALGLPFDEDVLNNSIDCLKVSQNDVEQAIVECAKYNANSSFSISVNYEVIHRTCNNTFRNNILLFKNESTYSSLKETKLFFVTMSVDKSETTNIVCIQPKITEFSFVASDFTLNLLTDHCYLVPEPESMLLKSSLPRDFFSIQNFSCSDSQIYNMAVSKGKNSNILTSEIFKTYQFWLFTVCLIASCTCISSIFTMSDTACHESIQTTGADYGRTRSFGAMSWGLIAPFAGFLNDYTGSYMASWGLMIFLCALQIWNLSKMDLVKPDSTQSILKDMKTVFSSMEFIAFEVGVFMNGVFTGVIWFYLTWFILSIGGNKLIIGLAHTVQCFFGEVPFMFYSSWIIKKMGHFNIVSLALFSHGLRFFIYSFLYNPWLILPIEILHGFTFGTFYSAMTSYGKLNSKPGTEATTQSVLCTTYEALGAGLGCIIFGECFDRFGGHTTFVYSAIIATIATAINMVNTLLLKCRKGALEVTKKNPGLS